MVIEKGINMRFTAGNAFKDLPYDENEQMADSFPLNIISGGSHLFGYLLKPDSRYEKPSPAVIMFHGFPGYTTNNDLEYALMRMGAVVIHVNHFTNLFFHIIHQSKNIRLIPIIVSAVKE